MNPQDDLEKRRSRLSPEKRALLEQRLRGGTPAVAAPRIPRRGSPGPAPLSFAQEQLWFLDRLYPGQIAYNLPLLFRLTGPLDENAFRESLNEIVRRHRVLHATFIEVQGEGFQASGAPGPAHVETHDLRDSDDAVATAIRLATENARNPFDLSAGAPCRFALMRIAEREHLFAAMFHHIVFDGWSTDVFLHELAALYEAFLTGKPSPLLPLSIQYEDFAEWQRLQFSHDLPEKSLAYWRGQLGGELGVLDLPVDRPRSPVQSFRGALQRRPLAKPLSDRVQEFGRQEGVTPFVTLLAAWKALLCRYTGQEDVIVGSAIAGRNWPEAESLIGFFVNTVAMRTDLSGDPDFQTLVRRVHDTALNAHEHQDVPFEKVVELVRPDRTMSRSELFQTMFVLQNTPIPLRECGGLALREEAVDNGTAKFDLSIMAVEREGRLTLCAEYSTDLFDPETIARLLEHYEVLLGGALADPDRRLSQLPLLTEAERRQLLVEWNDTTTAYPEDQTIAALFEEQVEQRPEAVALVFREASLTYRELNAQANRLARYLQGLGIGPDVLVGLCLPRSIEMVVATLAILKAGGAYLPLDPDYPAARLSYMIEDANPPVVIVRKDQRERLPACASRILEIDALPPEYPSLPTDNPHNAATASSLAYVMYTSGSTGNPKGVCVVQRGIVRLVRNTNYVTLGPDEVLFQFAPMTFDAATFELWGSLLNGAKLVVFPPGLPSLEELGQALKRYGVTTLLLTTGLFQHMAEQQLPALLGVRQLLTGGDVLSASHARRVLESIEGGVLINCYGPTECTVIATYYRMTSPSQAGSTVSIGRPLSNTTVYVLDRYGNPVPTGIVGELHVGGPGLARGYLNSPELTAERFVPDLFGKDPGGRLYKTGDLVCWRPDGCLEFMGRTDHQVKVRGFRVELGEIEAVLNRHPDVREAVVLARQESPQEKRLVAYIVPHAEKGIATSDLRAYLSQHVPDYLIPAAFVSLDAFPLTSNGKVDRRALPAPDRARSDLEAAYAAPETPVERAIAEVWSKLLHRDQVGARDNFFDLGGHSILAMQVVARLREMLARDLQLRDLFECPVLQALARRIETLTAGGIAAAPRASAPSTYDPCVVALRESGTKRPLFCVLGAGGVNYTYSALASRLDPDQPVFGLQYSQLPGAQEALFTVEEIAARYVRALGTVQPQGPYFIAGWSFGGVVAFEMAQQLHQRGDRTAVLAVMDCEAIVRIPNPVRRAMETLRLLRLRAQLRLVMIYHTTPVIRGYLRDIVRMAWSRRNESGRPRPSLREYWNFMWGDIYRQYSMKQAGVTTPSAREERLAMVDDSFVRNVLRRMKANETALKRYAMKPYPGRVTLFRARHDPYGLAERDPSLQWQKIAQDGVDVHVIDGNHLALVREPCAADLARELQACLDAAPRDLPAS